MKRGVIFTPVELVRNPEGTGFRTGKSVTELDINYFLLYWDKLLVPSNNVYRFGVPHEDELKSLGKLDTPLFRVDYMNDSIFPDFYAASQLKSLEQMQEKEKNVDWRIHYLNDQINLPDNDSTLKQTLRFELCNLLPVPGLNVNLNEILEFKERRSDELVALHSYMDELYFEIIKSGDFELSRAKAFNGFERALADLNSLNAQVWRSPIKFSLSSSLEFDLNQAMAFAAAGAVAMNKEEPLTMITTGAIASVLGGFFKVSVTMQSVLKSGNKNLAYLSKAKNEGVLG